MAVVAPFRALRYNTARIPDLSQVIVPPYDVIGSDEQKAFHARHPYSMIRLDLGESLPGDDEKNNPHTRAAAYLSEWQRNGILIRDPEAAVYPYELDYSVKGERRTRKGFMVLLRLEDFCDGCVRPHERTFQGVKDERFGLMTACHAHLSPIFALYSDPEGLVDARLASAESRSLCADFHDEHGLRHRLYRVSDRSVIEELRRFMLDKDIFIADGHHRYETSLAYRDWMRARHPEAPPEAPFNYTLVYLSNMDDPGLTILPTHRLLPHVDPGRGAELLSRLDPLFHVRSFSLDSSGIERWASELESAARSKETVIGFAYHGADRCYLLRGRGEKIGSFLEQKGFSEAQRGLDVVVVDHVILRGLLGLTDAYLGDSENILFRHDRDEALEQVRRGEVGLAFFINPTRIEQVRQVAGAGEIMPHKATYFYPKVCSGLVIHPIHPDEVVA